MLDQITAILKAKVFHHAPLPMTSIPEQLPQFWVDIAPEAFAGTDEDMWERVLHPAMLSLCGMLAKKAGIAALLAQWVVARREGYVSIGVIGTADQFAVAKAFAETPAKAA